jgi:hypothetical protein
MSFLKGSLWGLSVLFIIPVVLFADDPYDDRYREESAQKIVRLAEDELSRGNAGQASQIADLVLAEFPDTRAAYKAGEIKLLAAADEATSTDSGTYDTITVKPPRPLNACLWAVIPGGGQFYMANYHRRAKNRNMMWTEIAVGSFALAGTPVAGISSLVFLSQAEDPIVDDCCLGRLFFDASGETCVNINTYQTTCLVLGILTAAGVPLLWGGSAGIAWSEARKESTVDTFSIKSTDKKDQQPSFIRRCLFGKRGSW